MTTTITSIILELVVITAHELFPLSTSTVFPEFSLLVPSINTTTRCSEVPSHELTTDTFSNFLDASTAFTVSTISHEPSTTDTFSNFLDASTAFTVSSISHEPSTTDTFSNFLDASTAFPVSTIVTIPIPEPPIEDSTTSAIDTTTSESSASTPPPEATQQFSDKARELGTRLPPDTQVSSAPEISAVTPELVDTAVSIWRKTIKATHAGKKQPRVSVNTDAAIAAGVVIVVLFFCAVICASVSDTYKKATTIPLSSSGRVRYEDFDAYDSDSSDSASSTASESSGYDSGDSEDIRNQGELFLNTVYNTRLFDGGPDSDSEEEANKIFKAFRNKKEFKALMKRLDRKQKHSGIRMPKPEALTLTSLSALELEEYVKKLKRPTTKGLMKRLDRKQKHSGIRMPKPEALTLTSALELEEYVKKLKRPTTKGLVRYA